MLLVKRLQISVDPRDRQPVPRIIRIPRERVGHVQDAGHVLDPLHIPRKPQRRFGMARDQVSIMLLDGHAHASTQVSFEPPPWEEFTTSVPARSATRVSPP